MRAIDEKTREPEDSFFLDIRYLQNIRHAQRNNVHSIDRAEQAYSLFSFYCTALDGNRDSGDEFNKFIAEEKIELNFVQKKHLFERYFGYEFECIPDGMDRWGKAKTKWISHKKKPATGEVRET